MKRGLVSVGERLGWFSNRTGTSVDDGARKSNNWLNQWLSGKLGTGSRVWSFSRALPWSNDVPVLLLNQPIEKLSTRCPQLFAFLIHIRWRFLPNTARYKTQYNYILLTPNFFISVYSIWTFLADLFLNVRKILRKWTPHWVTPGFSCVGWFRTCFALPSPRP